MDLSKEDADKRSSLPYPMELGSPAFAPVDVYREKDIIYNAGKLHAQQEYDRIMELVAVLQKQAEGIKRRLDITDAVYAAEYQFSPVMGQAYWLVWNTKKEKMLLVLHGPSEWSTGVPEDYEYIAQVKYMGDHTWLEIERN